MTIVANKRQTGGFKGNMGAMDDMRSASGSGIEAEEVFLLPTSILQCRKVLGLLVFQKRLW